MASDDLKNLGVYADASTNVAYASHLNAKGMLYLTNNSGGNVSTADVVIIDTTTDASFTTNTTAGALLQIGVIAQDISGADTAASKTVANAEATYVYGPGSYCPAAAVDAAVSRYEYLKLSSSAKKLTGTGTTASATTAIPSGTVALALEDAGAAGNIKILVMQTVSAIRAKYPQRAVLWHGDMRVTNGNALALNIDTAQAYATTYRQNAAADADAFEQSFMMEAGTYTFAMLGITDSNKGKIDWSLDGTSIATGQDWYSASPTKNVEKTVSSVTVTGNGRHVLTGTVNGKNASSSGYEILLTRVLIKPSDDTVDTE